MLSEQAKNKMLEYYQNNKYLWKKYNNNPKRKKYNKIYSKKWRDKNPDYMKDYFNKPEIKLRRKMYESTSKRLIYKKRYMKKYKKTNSYKEKMKEYYSDNYYKIIARCKANKIKIPNGQICEICNEHLAVQRHHPNYYKPLEIKFTCISCNQNNK